MKKSISVIFSILFILSCSSCKKNFAEIIDDLGFSYDSSQDIYISKVNAWQQKAGYSSLIDLSSVPAGMVIDCEPITFAYNGKTYMIELWKGQYDLSTGSEIGIYKKSSPDVAIWKCGDKSDMLMMSYTLKKNGNKVFERSGKHWWLTGFKPGEFCNPGDLTMEISITLKDQSMLNSFVTGFKQTGYNINDAKINGDSIGFTFTRPKTKQPLTDQLLISETQKNNKLLIDTYNKAKTDANVKDNSPESIEKMLKKSPKLILPLANYVFSK